MKFETLTLKVEDRVAHIQLSRPAAYNSMSREFWKEFPAVLDAIDAAAEARVVVISSTGKHFSAGMDLQVFTQPDPEWFQGEAARRGEFLRRLVLDLQAIFNRLENIRMPVLSAIQGGCIGGALDLVCATDCRYCTEDAFFTVKETELGMTADLGTLQRLPGLIPLGLARELAYTSRKLLADEALSAGLVNGVYASQEEMLDAVMQVAGQIAANSPLAVTGTKNMLNYARDHSVADSLNYMATWQSGMFQPNDMAQAFAAKTQKKAPEFEAIKPIKPLFK